MKKLSSMLGVLSAILIAGHVYAEEDCKAKYTGTPAALPEADAKFLANALSLIKSKQRTELLKISGPRLLLVRRYVSGGVDSRGGNLWVEFSHKQIDKNLVVRIPPMKLPRYLAGQEGGELESHPAQEVEFVSQYYFPETDGTVIILNRTACGDDKKCDLLPFGPHFEEMVSGLMHCSANGKSAFLFKDGLLITGMDLIPWPIGEGLYFTKTPSGYKLAALIDFE